MTIKWPDKPGFTPYPDANTLPSPAPDVTAVEANLWQDAQRFEQLLNEAETTPTREGHLISQNDPPSHSASPCQEAHPANHGLSAATNPSQGLPAHQPAATKPKPTQQTTPPAPKPSRPAANFTHLPHQAVPPSMAKTRPPEARPKPTTPDEREMPEATEPTLADTISHDEPLPIADLHARADGLGTTLPKILPANPQSALDLPKLERLSGVLQGLWTTQQDGKAQVNMTLDAQLLTDCHVSLRLEQQDLLIAFHSANPHTSQWLSEHIEGLATTLETRLRRRVKIELQHATASPLANEPPAWQ